MALQLQTQHELSVRPIPDKLERKNFLLQKKIKLSIFTFRMASWAALPLLMQPSDAQQFFQYCLQQLFTNYTSHSQAVECNKMSSLLWRETACCAQPACSSIKLA